MSRPPDNDLAATDSRSDTPGPRCDGASVKTAIDWYDEHAGTVAELYEKATFETANGWYSHLLPPSPAAVLDVGAGSGRDASWFAANGYRVVAAEPSASMRAIAGRRYPDSGVRWIDDRLPDLDAVTRSGWLFDLIVCSAVWMHVPASDRRRAFRALIALLEPDGILAMTFREGPANRETCTHRVSLAEIKAMARERETMSELRFEASFRLGPTGSRWHQVAIGLPEKPVTG